MSSNKASPARKSLNDVKVKYSPVKKQNNKYNNVFVKGYKFGLMTLEFKKFSDPNEDAYFKDFLDLLDLTPKLVMILASSRLLLLGIQASAVLPKFKVLDTRLAIS
jgi:hypothetical protein